MRARKSWIFLFLLASAVGLAGYASAVISSRSYRIPVSELTTVPNTGAKTGGTYSMLGSTGQFGASAVSGGRYTVNVGIVNSWRPAQSDVSTAHVYPNPCSLKTGCNGITFTRLTLNAEINIYTVSGEKVRHISKASNIDSIGWDLRNDAGSKVASGLYLYVVRGDGSSKKGKIVLIR